MLSWITSAKDEYRNEGLRRSVMLAGRGAFNTGWFALTSRHQFGRNVFDREWDVLLVLDACRVDALRAVESEYDWLGPIGSFYSVGSSSHEWTAKTFTTEYAEEIGRTGLVTANPYARVVFEERSHPPQFYSIPFDLGDWNTVSREDFAYTEWCFQQTHGYEDQFSLQPAGHMTDRAIHAGRERDLDRLIVHYYQPHIPFLPRAIETGEIREVDSDPYAARRLGDLSEDELWDNYLENLRYALDSVELLLENLDAERVAITADHGELLGELGHYGHPEGVPHPALKKVPWAETTATDERTYEPNPEVTYENESETEEKLAALGYV